MPPGSTRRISVDEARLALGDMARQVTAVEHRLAVWGNATRASGSI